MKPRFFISIDPRLLHLPTSRHAGADAYKLLQQTARFGNSISGMPPPEVYRGSDGKLVVYNGVTRATRAAKVMPGVPITVEIIDDLRHAVGQNPTIGSTIP